MSPTIEIFKITLTFEGVLMLFLGFFDISVSLESAKNHQNRGLHIWRTPCIMVQVLIAPKFYPHLHYWDTVFTLRIQILSFLSKFFLNCKWLSNLPMKEKNIRFESGRLMIFGVLFESAAHACQNCQDSRKP